MSGPLTLEEYQEFSRLTDANKISTVIFKDCLGGNGMAAFRYAATIKQKKITTVASGVVASACAFAYLGGTVRTLDKAAAGTAIMFHGMFYESTLEPKGPIQNQLLLDMFEQHISFKFGAVVQEIILNTRIRDEGIYFYSMKSGAGFIQFALYCDGTAPINADNCKRLNGMTLRSEGITTD